MHGPNFLDSMLAFELEGCSLKLKGVFYEVENGKI